MRAGLGFGILLAGCAASPQPAPAVPASTAPQPLSVARPLPPDAQSNPLERARAINRTHLDSFIQAIETAANDGDRALLQELWIGTKPASRGGRNLGSLTQAELQWLAAMLQHDCGFVDDRNRWVCPRGAAQRGEKHNVDDGWLEFRRAPQGWWWTTAAFPSNAAAAMPDPPSKWALPSSAPVFSSAKQHKAPDSKRHGALDKEVIRTVVRTRIGDVRACYNKGLIKQPALTGRIAIQFTIGGDGGVTRAAIAESTVEDATVSRCIADAALTWTFPAPAGGGNVVVTYPFVLEPG